MKNIIFSLLTAVLVFVCCSGGKESTKDSTPSPKYTISGQVYKDSDISIVYLINYVNNSIIDSVTVDSDGNFRFEGIAPDTITLTVIQPDIYYEFPTYFWMAVLEEGDIILENDGLVYGQGTPTNDALKKWAGDLFYSDIPGSLYDYIDELWKSNAPDFVKAYCLMRQQEYLDFSDVDKYERSLSQSVKDSYLIRIGLSDLVEAQRHTQPGNKFVDAEVFTLDLKPVRLSDYVGRGSYTLVDFWASWCGPCRQAITELQPIARKNKKLQIVSVAVSDRIENTKTAADQLKIKWTVLTDLNNTASDSYGFRYIPFLVLFSPDGTIIARNPEIDSIPNLIK